MENCWLEVAIMASGLIVGNILFHHFEEQTPIWRRVVKAILAIGMTVVIANWLGRVWFFIILGVACLFPLVIHVWWLPRQGINGWTGEPKEKYYRLRGWKWPPGRTPPPQFSVRPDPPFMRLG